MATTSFRKPSQAPPVFTGTSDSILEEAKQLVAKSQKVEDELVARIKAEDATFENVLQVLAQDENHATSSNRVLSFYQAVSANKDLRDASSKAEEMMEKFAIESSMREDIYKLVESVYQKKETLDAESQRYLEKTRKAFVRNGLNIEAGPKRDRYKEIKLRLSELTIAFQKALNEEDGGVYFTREELDGVSADIVDDLQAGEGENKGKLKVTFQYPHLLPVLKYGKVPDTRKKLYMANENKCASNIPLFAEAILLRDEGARLLGYKSHAAFQIEDKMSKTPEKVNEFLNGLAKRLRPAGDKEIAVLQSLKKDDLAANGKKAEDNFFFWDHRYYSTLQLEKDYQIDQEKLSEYFPLKTTLSKMLEIFEHLMGLKFVEVVGKDRDSLSPTGKGEDLIWHEDVQMFAVWNDESEGDDFVGYLYTDMHPRLGKYGHAANFNLQPGWRMENGTVQRPATALVCNFSKPTPKKPSLLKHDEVTTLFHELGHGIHDLVGKSRYSRFHGTAVVQDFVEAPSQMLENWCWTPSQLKFLSHHYSTLSDSYMETWIKSSGSKDATPPPKVLPDSLTESLVKTRHVNEALATLRQLHFGLFDMKVHDAASHEELKKLSPALAWGELRHQLVPIDGPEKSDGLPLDWAHGEAGFGHLMGSYDAGYYGYLSSLVYSTDMFYTVFKQDPMNGQEGRRYRKEILEWGGSRDEMESLKAFLGREPNADAFYTELGLR